MSLTDDQPSSQSSSPSSSPPKERAHAAVEAAKQETREMAHTATESASTLAGKARDEMRSRTDEQAHRAADAMRGFSQDLRSMADAGEGERTAVHDVVRTAAEKMEQFSGHLEERGFSGLVDDIADFGRRNPGTFLLAAAAAGAATARLFRSADTTSLKESVRQDLSAEQGELRGGSPQALTSSSTGTAGTPAMSARPGLHADPTDEGSGFEGTAFEGTAATPPRTVGGRAMGPGSAPATPGMPFEGESGIDVTEPRWSDR